MVKNILIGLLVITVSGCSSIGKWLPSEFDNVEYGKLVELNVISNMPQDDWCKKSTINQMNYRAQYLHTYADNRLNDNIVEIYKGVHGLTQELVDKEEPSQAYCRIKRTNIHDITTNMLAVFGDRK